MRSADVVAGVQRESQALDVIAQHHGRIGVLRQAADGGFHSDPRAFQGGQIDESSEPFDFLVERCAQFAGGHDEGHDFGGLGQFADGAKLPVVLLTGGPDIHAVGHDVQPMDVPAQNDRPVEVRFHFRRSQLNSVLIDRDFNV